MISELLNLNKSRNNYFEKWKLNLMNLPYWNSYLIFNKNHALNENVISTKFINTQYGCVYIFKSNLKQK